jgi:hypothetical protein
MALALLARLRGTEKRENSLTNYLSTGYNSIEGWVMEAARDMTLSLAELQRDYVEPGPILEIGVWQARYLALLSFVPVTATPVIGIDPIIVTGDRNAHIATLKANIQQYARRPDLVTLIEKGSGETTAEELFAIGNDKFQFISIDGSHLFDAVMSDLRLAEATLADGGIVAVDDISNPIAPGVWHAFVMYGSCSDAKLEAVVNSGNKLFLTQKEFAARYREDLLARCKAGRLGQLGIRITEFRDYMAAINQPMKLFGQEVLVYPGF